MTCQMKQLSCGPVTIKGMSERLIATGITMAAQSTASTSSRNGSALIVMERSMSRLVRTTVLIAVVIVTAGAFGAERFQKLSGTQIHAKFAGMEMTDNTHFSDVFGASGMLESYGMGKKKIGKWRVQKDELCVDRGKDDGGCYQVWMAGKKIEFRHEGSDFAIQEGVLKASTRRD